LIIDSFGELREKEKSTKEDMKVHQLIVKYLCLGCLYVMCVYMPCCVLSGSATFVEYPKKDLTSFLTALKTTPTMNMEWQTTCENTVLWQLY